MRRHLLPLLLTAAALGGCESAVTVDRDALGGDDARALAAELDLLGASVLDQMLLSPGISFSVSPSGGASLNTVPVPIAVTFNRTAACPLGGQISLAGTISGSRDREARTVETKTVATKTLSACAVSGRGGVTITSTGSVALTATQKSVNGVPSGLQTRTNKGSVSFTTSAGASGSCAIDIVSTFDPATRTRTIKGTTCRRTIDLTTTRG